MINVVRWRSSEIGVPQEGVSDGLRDPRDEPHQCRRGTEVPIEEGREAHTVGRLCHPLEGGKEKNDLRDSIRR